MSKITIILLCFTLWSTFANSQTKNNITVTQYGAKGNDNIDDTQFFQQAIDVLASKNGGTLIIPEGTYYISHLKFFGKKYSNITLIGQNAIINQILPEKRTQVHNGQWNTYAERLSADGCFVFDAMVSHQKNDNLSIKNIKITGLTFNSFVNKYGFDELTHQISAHGVSNFKVDNCNFIGFLGDGIAINAGTDLRKYGYAYNKDIVIRNCNFDGINKDNRQGVSIYYADGFVIENCDFKNTTRSDMPGAIDVEPDKPNLITRNGKIENCSFTNIGGIAAVCFIIKGSAAANDFSNNNFTVNNCRFNNVSKGIAVINTDSKIDPIQKEYAIKFTNSTVVNAHAIADFRYASNVYLKQVSFKNINNTNLNVVTDGGAYNIKFENCNFQGIKNQNGFGFTGDTKQISFVNCNFQDFAIHAITINKAAGLGQLTGNNFMSTKYNGGYPLVIPRNTKRNQILNSAVRNNTTKGNFKTLDLNEFIAK